MGTRVQLQAFLEALLGTENVYYQTPENVKMKYPCIVYSRSNIMVRTLFADDGPYVHRNRYSIIYIDQNPDSEFLDKLAALPLCGFERSYTAHNLNHYVYNLYF